MTVRLFLGLSDATLRKLVDAAFEHEVKLQRQAELILVAAARLWRVHGETSAMPWFESPAMREPRTMELDLEASDQVLTALGEAAAKHGVSVTRQAERCLVAGVAGYEPAESVPAPGYLTASPLPVPPPAPAKAVWRPRRFRVAEALAELGSAALPAAGDVTARLMGDPPARATKRPYVRPLRYG